MLTANAPKRRETAMTTTPETYRRLADFVVRLYLAQCREQARTGGPST